MKKIIAIVGGGAAGLFAAIEAAKTCAEVHIFEATAQILSKVKLSGGGRCNLTHAQFDPSLFGQNYPRGSRELLSAFDQFQAQDTITWFEARGVKLFWETDLRVFPISQDSQTIVDCLIKEAKKSRVQIHYNHLVKKIRHIDETFQLHFNGNHSFSAARVLLCCGGTGHHLAKNLGHTITDLAPSLFGFKCSDSLLKDCAGTSFFKASLKLNIATKTFKSTGALLITHLGLSGPAVLQLSSLAARELKKTNYQAQISINWGNFPNQEQIRQILFQIKKEHPKALCTNIFPHQTFTKKFWTRLLEEQKLDSGLKWGELANKKIETIAQYLCATPLNISGRAHHKEEFVRCGGIKLSEVNFKTMESKLIPGLFFAGEVLDIDGLTGGFNLQNAWTTGMIAGKNLGKYT